jgi:hypothetical protein
MSIEDKVVEAVEGNLADLNYWHKRDVRLTLVVEDGKAVWLAVQDGTDEFDVSDIFDAVPGDEESALTSRYRREQAFLAVKLGHAVSLDEAAASVAAYDLAKAAKAKPKKSKAAS